MNINPCPFCGHSNVRFRDSTHWTGMQFVLLATELIHECSDDEFLRVSVKIRAKTQDEAIDKWNNKS